MPAPSRGLPGYSLPLKYRPEANFWDLAVRDRLFYHALDYDDTANGCAGRLHTTREITMLQVMAAISEKPDWNDKVFDESITSKWRHEVRDSGRDVTDKMMDWIIKEMQWKAGILEREGYFHIFDIGVVRSDTAVGDDLRTALCAAVAPLEDVPEDHIDYHPGSDGKVIDLVHPSLFSLVYGRTRILPESITTVDSCIESIGEGQVLPIPSEKETPPRDRKWWDTNGLSPFSRKFQWLPCDVQFTEDGSCRIVSYINNLHPVTHRELYRVVEKVITEAIPLWNQSLTPTRQFFDSRIQYAGVEYLPHPLPEPVPEDEEDPDYGDYSDKLWEWEQSRPVKLPEPGRFTRPRPPSADQVVKLREWFQKDGLQVIVKLANIKLTPEKPEYEGGSWHIEGQLNERICATAIYYYDSNNITESALEFRQRASDMDDVQYGQGQHQFVQHVFGFDRDAASGYGQITQDLGGVVCREGRLITFPNIVQHRVAPFKLADRSKPGHRKILALFLVDPHMRIISTANVPPQQAGWAQHLPSGDCETITPATMSLHEAKEYRLQLMKERGAKQTRQNQEFETGSFNLCEH